MRSPLLAGTLFTLLLVAHIATVLSLVRHNAPIRGSMHPAAPFIATAS
ncbi:MAG: hypothetical protein AAB544_01390 [Patescibacteria group bacterium]